MRSPPCYSLIRSTVISASAASLPSAQSRLLSVSSIKDASTLFPQPLALLGWRLLFWGWRNLTFCLCFLHSLLHNVRSQIGDGSSLVIRPPLQLFINQIRQS